MKKEPLPIMIVKTLLAVIIFAGLGTIIVGGACLIGKDYKNETNNKTSEPINQETKNYYDLLEKKYNLKEDCWNLYAKYQNSRFYSFYIMKENNYREADENGRCPEGFRANQLERPYEGSDHNSLVWCEPVVTKDDILIIIDKTEYQQGEEIKFTIENKLDKEIEFFVSLEKYENKEWKTIDREIFCNSPRTYSCGEKTIFSNSFKEFNWNQENNFKIYVLDGIYRFKVMINAFMDGGYEIKEPIYISSNKFIVKNQDNISDWQTYRNEEFGFEVKYPSNYKVGPRKNLIELEPNDYNKYCLITIGQRPSFKNVLFIDWHQKNMVGNQDFLIKEENKNQMVKTVEADGIQTLTNYTYFTNEEIAIYLSCNKDKDNSIYDQILSTFKFIEN